MSDTAQFLTSLIAEHQVWAYVLIFLVSIPEGPKLTVLCGFLVLQGLLNPLIVYVLVVLGDVIGDSGWYWFGGLAFESLSPHWRQRLGLTEERTERVVQYFEHRPFAILASSKLVHGIGLAGIIAAGSIAFPYRRFVFICFMVSLMQSAVLIAVGVLAASSYERMALYVDRYTAIASALVLVVVLFILVRKFASETVNHFLVKK